jgi:prepilin-type N-terminal cleavage/methylation domain-containing protein
MVNKVLQSRRRGGFTLIELLAVVVIISLLATLTLTAYRALAKDARISLATNTLRVALQTARASAIELNKRTMLVFRPVVTGFDSQQIEAVVVVDTGYVFKDPNARIPVFVYSQIREDCLALRFEPVPGTGPFLLPKGVMPATAIHFMLTTNYEAGNFGEPDASAREEWISPSYLPEFLGGSPHAPGVVMGVTFDRTGVLRTSFSDTGSQLAFVDFNGDGAMQCGDACFSMLPYDSNGLCTDGVPEPGVDYNCTFGFDQEEDEEKLNLFYGMEQAEDEPYVLIAPFIALYDYDEAREFYSGDTKWVSPTARLTELDQFARRNARVLYFNRFTGGVSE